MNRCFSRHRRTSLTVAALMLVACASVQVVHAQQSRTFNHRVERAVIEFTSPPYVKVNGKETRLSAGSRLYNEQNRIIMANSVKGRKLTVHYLKDNMGQVADMWILTPRELAGVSAAEKARMRADAGGDVLKPAAIQSVTQDQNPYSN